MPKTTKITGADQATATPRVPHRDRPHGPGGATAVLDGLTFAVAHLTHRRKTHRMRLFSHESDKAHLVNLSLFNRNRFTVYRLR